MATSQKCPKCGHAQLLQGVRVISETEGQDRDVWLRVDAHPEAMIFKRAQYSPLRASVCSNCGFTELFADEPASLYAAYRESQT
jgi:predicted nucleic-acid-binding Zn-ribbon protein